MSDAVPPSHPPLPPSPALSLAQKIAPTSSKKKPEREAGVLKPSFIHEFTIHSPSVTDASSGLGPVQGAGRPTGLPSAPKDTDPVAQMHVCFECVNTGKERKGADQGGGVGRRDLAWSGLAGWASPHACSAPLCSSGAFPPKA